MDPKVPKTKGGVQNRGVGLYIPQGEFKNPGGRKGQQRRKHGHKDYKQSYPGSFGPHRQP